MFCQFCSFMSKKTHKHSNLFFLKDVLIKNFLKNFFSSFQCISILFQNQLFLSLRRLKATCSYKLSSYKIKKCNGMSSLNPYIFSYFLIIKGTNQRITTEYGYDFAGTVFWSAPINQHSGCTRTLNQNLMTQTKSATCAIYQVAQTQNT